MRHQPSSLCVTARYYHPLLIATGVRFRIAPTKGPSVGQHNDEILGSLGETSALTPHGKIQKMELRRRFAGAVRRLVGIEVGVVSGVSNLESPGVDAPGWRLRHEEAYHAV